MINEAGIRTGRLQHTNCGNHRTQQIVLTLSACESRSGEPSAALYNGTDLSHQVCHREWLGDQRHSWFEKALRGRSHLRHSLS